ncbi:hypothetical protein GR160_13835 [Flavobacterium sp. Sd200]|nr:hypothetical protein [Flavobacterium sp. Sd200]
MIIDLAKQQIYIIKELKEKTSLSKKLTIYYREEDKKELNLLNSLAQKAPHKTF